MGLRQVADEIQSAVSTRLGNVGKVDVSGQIGQSDMEKRIVNGVVAVVGDERAFVALRVVILGSVKTVVDKYHAAACDFLCEGENKGVLGGV